MILAHNVKNVFWKCWNIKKLIDGVLKMYIIILIKFIKKHNNNNNNKLKLLK